MKHLHVILVFILFIACNQSESAKSKITDIVMQSPGLETIESRMEAKATDSSVSAFTPPQPGDPQQVKKSSTPSQLPESKPDWNKKIIKTGTLNVEVKEYASYNQLVHAAATRFGGYVADEQQTETEYKIENTITIKVLVDQFQSAVDHLTNGSGRINEKKISSEDVTTQYVDTKSRLEAKKQVRLRYLELLKQAKNMEEILQVQNEINDIQEEIESAAGRINYLSNASAMSTIHLTFFQILNPAASDPGNDSMWEEVKSAFLTGWNGVGDVLIGLVYIWPLLVVGVVLIWVLKRVSFKTKKVIQ